MAASRDTTALLMFQRAWNRVERSVGKTLAPGDWDRFALINEVCPLIQALFADILSPIFLRETPLVSGAGKYYTAAAAWAAATDQLTATMNVAFDVTDIGALITFNVGNLVYNGTITQVVSGTVVKVQGNTPNADTAINYVTVAPTAVAGDQVSIGGLRILSTGSQIEAQLLSSMTPIVDIVSPFHLQKFRPQDIWNQNKIVYAVVGDNLKLKRGLNLQTYGVLTYQYPHVCDPVTLDTDFPDLPDGAAMDIAILKMARMLAFKAGVEIADTAGEMENTIKALYRGMENEIQAEPLQEKITALK